MTNKLQKPVLHTAYCTMIQRRVLDHSNFRHAISFMIPHPPFAV